MKVNIKNRYDQNISLIYNEMPDSKGLAFFQHGLGGYKEQDVMQAMVSVFNACSISTIAFDSRHSFGESYGELELANLKNHSEDLEDVIAWAEKQEGYIEPFYLVAHSLGGASILNYLFKNPNKVKAIAPISSILEGRLYAQAKGEDVVRDWRDKGYQLRVNPKNKEDVRKVTYQYYEHVIKCDFIKGVENFKDIPLLSVVGSNDRITPSEHQKILYNRWGCSKKTYHEIMGCGHSFKSPEHLEELKQVLADWIKLVN